MPIKTAVPVLSTHDLWKEYIDLTLPMENFFKGQADDFLILRIEDWKAHMRLPTQPHRRLVNEIVFVTSGSTSHTADLNRIDMKAGDLHLMMAGQITTIEQLSSDATGFYCHFSNETLIRLYHREYVSSELAALGNRMKAAPFSLKDKCLASVLTIFQRLLDEYNSASNLNLIDAYLVTLCQEIKNAEPSSQFQEQNNRAFQLTEDFKQLITRHIHQHQTLAYYAEQLSISPNHLNKVVKQIIGKSASALITDSIILEAKVLLKHSNLSISQIAFQLGFEDLSYFSRYFRIRTATTPSEYRQARD